MVDYRLPQHRSTYFHSLYEMTLKYGVSPNLVYLYLPALAAHYGWSTEQRYWYAFLNGLTQNCITSLRLFKVCQAVPTAAEVQQLRSYFNDNWDSLQYDTDRRYQKALTIDAIEAYAHAVHENGGTQAKMLSGKPFLRLWDTARSYKSFGRLSAFSYLEYLYISELGADCSSMFFNDRSGSRSHRNGILYLLGLDMLVWDRRAGNGFAGNYSDFEQLCVYLEYHAQLLLEKQAQRQPHPHACRYTLESVLCTFKNHFFGRRYAGVYADMSWQRIQWADERGQREHTEVFKAIRSQHLPSWLRDECAAGDQPSMAARASMFPSTGQPYRMKYLQGLS